MKQTEYEQKRRECWEEFCKSNGLYDQVHVLVPTAFYFAFDCAYELGREKETITQEEIENEAVDYAFGENKKRPDARPNTAPEYMAEDLIDAFKAGANFALGDRVRIKDGYYKEELHGCIGTIRKIDGCHIYVEVDSTIYPATIHSIEPYTEPKEESRNLSQETANCDYHFDNILKDSFAKERRLNIAAMAMQGYLSSNGSGDPKEIAHYALAVADALIKASEEGGSK